MPDDITVRHPQYDVAKEDWWRPCRDTRAGEIAVKAAKTKYVPMLEGMSQSDEREYLAYVQRGTFYPAMERTLAGLTGMVMRKPAQVNVPSTIDVESQITEYGGGLTEIAIDVLEEALVAGRAGISVDWSNENNRPYWTLWRAEQITNWHAEFENGTVVLKRVVLQVPHWERVSAYAVKLDIRYRELARLTDLSGGPRAMTREWREVEIAGQKTWTADPWIPYIRRGRFIPEIPFVFVGPRTNGPDVDKPPLLDLALMNLSHWRSSCDYEHGLHFTSLPTPYVTGWANSNTPLRIGSGTAWVIPHAEARVGMLEFTGQGLEAVAKALERKEHHMATLGARLIEGRAQVNETAEAVRLRHSGDASALAVLAGSVSRSLTEALRFHVWWQGFQVEATRQKVNARVEVQLNQDYLESRLTAQELEALMKSWQSGGISQKTLYWNLQQGEIARPNVTFEEEKAEIEQEEPAPTPDPAVTPPPED